jgi:hypothetical protein
MRAVAGVLEDGTPYFAPIGELAESGDKVACHLCGRLFRSVTAHLRSHRWTKEQYCEAFGLERSQSLEGTQTRKLRSAAFAARLIFEAAVRDGSAAGRELARSGELTRLAAAAARGRAFPEQRRRKASAASPPAARELLAQASRERADEYLEAVAAHVAARAGYRGIGDFVVARVRGGASLATISRDAGLHKDWLSRHLARIDPDAAKEATRARPAGRDLAWSPVTRQLGFEDLAAYLRERHLVQHRSVNEMAAELGTSFHTVAAAMRRHGIEPIRHAAARHAADDRAAEVAQRLRYTAVTDYIAERRAEGWTWRAISEECDQPESWLRRHAGGRGN